MLHTASQKYNLISSCESLHMSPSIFLQEENSWRLPYIDCELSGVHGEYETFGNTTEKANKEFISFGK